MNDIARAGLDFCFVLSLVFYEGTSWLRDLTSSSFSRLQIFRSTLQGVFSERHAQTLPLTEITDRLNKDYPDAKFTTKEVDEAVHRMTEDNQIMLSDGTVFLV